MTSDTSADPATPSHDHVVGDVTGHADRPVHGLPRPSRNRIVIKDFIRYIRPVPRPLTMGKRARVYHVPRPGLE